MSWDGLRFRGDVRFSLKGWMMVLFLRSILILKIVLEIQTCFGCAFHGMCFPLLRVQLVLFGFVV